MKWKLLVNKRSVNRVRWHRQRVFQSNVTNKTMILPLSLQCSHSRKILMPSSKATLSSLKSWNTPCSILILIWMTGRRRLRRPLRCAPSSKASLKDLLSSPSLIPTLNGCHSKASESSMTVANFTMHLLHALMEKTMVGVTAKWWMVDRVRTRMLPTSSQMGKNST